nr:hypothetical protein CFP56_11801 [Quercus suber]
MGILGETFYQAKIHAIREREGSQVFQRQSDQRMCKVYAEAFLLVSRGHQRILERFVSCVVHWMPVILASSLLTDAKSFLRLGTLLRTCARQQHFRAIDAAS